MENTSPTADGYSQPSGSRDPLLQSVTEAVLARTLRSTAPNRFYVSGFVVTQPVSKRKGIIDVAGERWLSPADMERIVQWKDPVESGEAPSDLSDERGKPASAAAALPRVVERTKAALITPASHAGSDLTRDEVLVALARDIGCVYNDAIAHNTGWFVPGVPTAFESPTDAIGALVGILRKEARVHQAACAKATPHQRTPESLPATADVDPRQLGFF